MKAIIENQYTAARAYFLCVIALLFIESAIHLPFYYLELRNRGRPQIKSSPTHSKLTTYLHKLFTLPSFIPFIADYHLPNILRVAVFAGLNVLWGYNSIEFSTDYTLYGWLTIANGGLALLLAARTNLFSLVLRIPSATLLFYHRWIGIATVAHATAHFALNTQHDIRTDQLATAYSNRRIQVGIMAWLALCIIGITSISFIRRRWFEAFYYSHALFFVFVVGALIHATKGPEFLLPGLLLWGVDRAIRFVYNFRRVEVKSMTSYLGDVVKFKLEGPKVTHPGQMAWIQIPGVSFLNWHPFTIASSPGDQEITVAVRGLGRYTKRLSLLASDSKAEQSEASSDATGKISAGQIRMRLDGPYGVGGVRWGLHPVTVLVAGGIGITPGISIASHIIKQAALPDSKRNSTQEWHIHLLWVIKDIRHTTWFEDELKQLALLASSTTTPVTLDITIHVTGGSTSQMESLGQEEAYAMETPYKYDGPGMVVEGRPDVTKWFGEVETMRHGLDTVVNVCGPRPLINNVRRAAAKLSWEGGHFLVEEEVFEL